MLYICVLFVEAPQLLASTLKEQVLFLKIDNMGIIYQVKIRCLKVKNLAEVDLQVLNEESNREAYQAKLSAYYEASKANLDAQLALYDHDPSSKRDYTLMNIYVPPGTNVIAVGNNACDRLGADRYYKVQFFNFSKTMIEEKKVCATSERNNFMLLVPPETFFMDYEIGRYNVHDYDFGPRCTYCLRGLHSYESDSSHEDFDDYGVE